MHTLYLDIFSGISGDMFLGAMLDLGLDFGELKSQLALLPLSGYELSISKGFRSGIQGTKFDVLWGDTATDHSHRPDHSHDHSHSHSHSHDHSHSHSHDHSHSPDHDGVSSGESRNFHQITQMLQQSVYSEWVKEKSLAVFRRIAIAEGKVHGQPPEAVHFHEVGAIDSIVDIVGSCIALELWGKPRLLAGPVVEGTGWVDCAHGRFPVPTAATLEILGGRGISLTQCDEPHELVTPTGAALLAEFVERFGPMHNLVARRIGYGLGTRENRTRPNVLRAILSD
jgi:pyridinium-3,5-bisthiocarboxylic acid mononucleotide nickel chelatase